MTHPRIEPFSRHQLTTSSCHYRILSEILSVFRLIWVEPVVCMVQPLDFCVIGVYCYVGDRNPLRFEILRDFSCGFHPLTNCLGNDHFRYHSDGRFPSTTPLVLERHTRLGPHQPSSNGTDSYSYYLGYFMNRKSCFYHANSTYTGS